MTLPRSSNRSRHQAVEATSEPWSSDSSEGRRASQMRYSSPDRTARGGRSKARSRGQRNEASYQSHEEWINWYFYPGHSHSPLHILSRHASNRFRPAGMNGMNEDEASDEEEDEEDESAGENVVFWTLARVKKSRKVVDMQLAMVILVAEEGDRRVKEMRQRLYPGSVLRLPSKCYTLTPLAPLPAMFQSQSPSHSQSRYDVQTTPRKRNRASEPHPLLVPDLQHYPHTSNALGPAGLPSQEFSYTYVQAYRMEFKYPPPSRVAEDVMVGTRRDEWGDWVNGKGAMEFGDRVRDKVEELLDELEKGL